MEYHEILSAVRALIDEVKFGILATLDADGAVWQRWMSPVIIPRMPESLFCVSSIQFRKIPQIEAHAKVSWIFQTPSLERIATLRGTASIIHDPMLSAEVLEAIGPRLRVFWKYSENPSDMAVIETRIEELEYFVPLKGMKETAKVVLHEV